jgi:hypothetical protein
MVSSGNDETCQPLLEFCFEPTVKRKYKDFPQSGHFVLAPGHGFAVDETASLGARTGLRVNELAASSWP